VSEGSAASGPDWGAWRREFPILQDSVYLNACSLGPLARRVRAAVGRFLDDWDAHGAAAWYELWLGEVQALRASFARLIGAKPSEIAILPSVTDALRAVASCLRDPGRPAVVTSELDFPTVPYQWLSRPDAEVRFARSEDGETVPVDAYRARMDARVQVLATSHVYFLSGRIQDIGALAALAREHGAYLLVDGYQGLGQVPFDAPASGADFVIGGGLKWLLGGPGVVYLYVREALHARLDPRGSGWFAHADPFSFRADAFVHAADARRFEGGTPAIAAVFAGRAGLDIVNEIGAQRLREREVALVADLAGKLRARGWRPRVPEDPSDHAGIVTVPMDDPRGAVAYLKSQGIVTDSRPSLLRISPYFFNEPSDHDAVVDALEAFRRGARALGAS
jgi:selenocysteine lyase/cysteine desulfurase